MGERDEIGEHLFEEKLKNLEKKLRGQVEEIQIEQTEGNGEMTNKISLMRSATEKITTEFNKLNKDMVAKAEKFHLFEARLKQYEAAIEENDENNMSRHK